LDRIRSTAAALCHLVYIGGTP